MRRALVQALLAASPAFAAAWRSRQVLGRERGIRIFEHAKLGLCRYEQQTLRPAQHGELKLTVLIPQS